MIALGYGGDEFVVWGRQFGHRAYLLSHTEEGCSPDHTRSERIALTADRSTPDRGIKTMVDYATTAINSSRSRLAMLSASSAVTPCGTTASCPNSACD